MNYPHIAVRTEGGKLNLEALLSRLRQNSEARRPDETVTQWQRRISYERLTASCREIEDARLTQLLQRKDYLCAEREAAGISLRRARDKGKHPPPENSIRAEGHPLQQHPTRDPRFHRPVSSAVASTGSGLDASDRTDQRLTPCNHQGVARLQARARLQALDLHQGLGKERCFRRWPAWCQGCDGGPRPLSYLSQPIGKDDDGTLTLGDTLTETNEDRERHLPDGAWQHLDQVLPERERDVLLARHRRKPAGDQCPARIVRRVDTPDRGVGYCDGGECSPTDHGP